MTSFPFFPLLSQKQKIFEAIVSFVSYGLSNNVPILQNYCLGLALLSLSTVVAAAVPLVLVVVVFYYFLNWWLILPFHTLDFSIHVFLLLYPLYTP